MRPRLVTAEHQPVSAAKGARLPCFNEAAAHHRGTQPPSFHVLEQSLAFEKASAPSLSEMKGVVG